MATYDLSAISPEAPKGFDKKDTKKATKKLQVELGELQNLMYAENKHSLIVVLQGMDASGKGGACRKVFKEVNPLGVKVYSFKKPSKEEMEHEFLWRVHKNVPEKGMIQIYDRSHYEDILITRVEGWVDDETAKEKMEHINNFEKLMKHNNTTIIKFYLHISEEEQKKRFYERVMIPEKRWKYGPEDLEKAKQWPAYRKVYEDAFNNCSDLFPWVVVPSNDNWYKEYVIAKTVVDTLKGFNMEYPDGDIDLNHPDVQALIQEVEKNKE